MKDVSEHRPNPLLLPEILDKIFGYLRLADLKKSRLVNWTWNSVTNGVMKTKGVRMVGFSNVDNEHLRLRRYKFLPIEIHMRRFLNCVERTKEKTEFPITRILVQITFDQMDAEFLHAIAPFVEELWIQLDVRRGLPQSESPLFQHIDYPALRKLRIFYVDCPPATIIEFWDDYGFEYDDFWDKNSDWALPKIKQKNPRKCHPHKLNTIGHDRFLANLLTSAPFLESFSVILDLNHENRAGPSRNTIRRCFTPTMRGLRFGNKVRTFREFETTLPYDNRSLMRLSNMKLSTLKIRINLSAVDSTTFRAFLQSQSELLKTLTITNEVVVTRRHTDQGGFYVDFPEMTALQSLTVGEHERGGHLKYRNISYRKQFPALKLITFLFSEDAVRNFYLAEDTSDTVAELRVKALDTFWEDSDYFRYFSHEVFPNLRKLEIGAEKFAMIHVYENLHLLEHLHLYISDTFHDFDSSIFGCECFSCSNNINVPCWNQEYVDNKDRKLSIASLSHLKTLRLSLPGFPLLEDEACRRIMTCPSLIRVVLETGHSFQPVSDLMLNEMRTKFEVEIQPYDRVIDKWCYD